jgi:hypothetical protein
MFLTYLCVCDLLLCFSFSAFLVDVSVEILSPVPGARWSDKVRILLEVTIGHGPLSEKVRANVSGFEVFV